MIVKFIGGPKDGECSWPYKEALRMRDCRFVVVTEVNLGLGDVPAEEAEAVTERLERSVKASELESFAKENLGDQAEEFLSELSKAQCHMYFLTKASDDGLEFSFHKTMSRRPTPDDIKETIARSPIPKKD